VLRPARPFRLPGLLVSVDRPGNVLTVARETLVITWMDGKVATYEDVTHSTRDGWLYIYGGHDGALLLWAFPSFNIRARGPRPWTADVELPAEEQPERKGPYAP
jgi:hypothetical protein